MIGGEGRRGPRGRGRGRGEGTGWGVIGGGVNRACRGGGGGEDR